jgi:hypothetical protein
VLLLAITRPEGVMFFIVLVSYRLFYRRSGKREVFQSVLLFIFLFGLFLIWRYQTYGYLLPNTAYIKINTSLWTIRLAFEWLLDFFVLRPTFTLVLMVSIIILIRERKLFDQQWSLIVMIVGVIIAFVLYAGRDWMPFHRFLVPLVPIFAILISKTFASFQTKLSRIVVISLITSIGIFELFLGITVYQDQIIDFGKFSTGLLDAGKIIKQETHVDSTIAVEDAGALAYSSERMSIDILGLNNKYIAHHPDLDIPKYVLSFHPVIVQLHLERLPSGKFIGSPDSAINDQFLNHTEFMSCYKLSTEWLNDPYMPYLFYRECD